MCGSTGIFISFGSSFWPVDSLHWLKFSMGFYYHWAQAALIQAPVIKGWYKLCATRVPYSQNWNLHRKLLPNLDDNSISGKKAMGFSTPFSFRLSNVSAGTVVKCLWFQVVTGEPSVCAFTKYSTLTHEREQPAHTAQLMPGLCWQRKYHLNKTSRQKTI